MFNVEYIIFTPGTLSSSASLFSHCTPATKWSCLMQWFIFWYIIMNVSQLAQCPVLPQGDFDYHIAQTLSFSYISFLVRLLFFWFFFFFLEHSMLYLNQSTADLYLTSSPDKSLEWLLIKIWVWTLTKLSLIAQVQSQGEVVNDSIPAGAG